ncbi:MAG: response regulator transcription factor [Bacteroidetes bacterium]|nr:response regulator transcription factor [Bacteroidota bacterium]
MISRKPSIALIDDHYIVRKGLRNLIEAFNEFNILFDVESFVDLELQLKNNRHLDILLMDIKMPIKNGFEVALWMRDKYPLIKVLALSSEEDGFSIAKVIRNGAKGFVGKSTTPTELLLAIQTVLRGDIYLSQISLNMFNEVLQNSTGYFTTENIIFTDKEREFIRWSCTSLKYQEIADRMIISLKTLEGYRATLFSRIGIQTRQELAVYAAQNNLLQ